MKRNARAKENILELFTRHISDHKRLPESTRARDWGSERSLTRDYSGRVVYELIQNAADRAVEHIMISLDEEGKLVVGNDGAPVSAYPMEEFEDENERSDFHALLSLHSSNKSAQESIGNKGVGFRSVFSASRNVEVLSRMESGGWWGIAMRHPDTAPADFPETEWKSNKVASFYNPSNLIKSEQEMIKEFGEEISYLQTIVTLDLDTETKKEAEETIKTLRDLPLRYLEPRLKNPEKLKLNLRLNGNRIEKSISSETHWEFADAEPILLDEKTRDIVGLYLDYAQMKVGYFTGPEPDEEDHLDPHGSAVYWSYLPTEQPAGFGVHIHGDFYLNNSRRNVNFSGESDSTPPAYNMQLLKSAAETIVYKLWMNPKVHGHEEFWRLINPRSCECLHLRHLVGGLLLQEEVFTALVKASFPANGDINWGVNRYRDFFKTVADWADYAYRNNSHMGLTRNTLSGWNEALIRWVRISGALVLPILSELGDKSTIVEYAVALPGRRTGGKKKEFTVFFRSSGSGFSMPEVFRSQQKLVTTFRPPSGDTSELGMTEFNRVELIASLDPGRSNVEQRQLINSVLTLASESQERGGIGSILERCQGLFGKRAFGWRYLAASRGKTQSDLEKAGFALSRLDVPTLDHGWVGAGKVTWCKELEEVLPTLREKWPWPILDIETLVELLPKIEADEGAATTEMTVEEACLLLGIGPIPLDRTEGSLVIEGFGDIRGRDLKRLVARCLIENWDDFLRPFAYADTEEFDEFFKMLRAEPWIPVDLSDSEGKLLISSGLLHQGNFLSPDELWVQQPRGGFRTIILNTYTPQSASFLPGWIRDLDICEIGESATEDRINKGLVSLGEMDIGALSAPSQRSLEETYRRLIRSKSDEDVEGVPVLLRRLRKGQMEGLKWMEEGDSGWFDNGEHTSLLSAFDNLLVWVVRREKVNLARAVGISVFNPERKIMEKGFGDDKLSRDLSIALDNALPDLIAAASTVETRSDIDFDQAIRNWAVLEVRHYEDVWMNVSLGNGLEGALGSGELGDVFHVPGDETTSAQLVFDIPNKSDLPVALIECGLPMADALFDNREITPAITAVLTAWSLSNKYFSHRDNNSINRMRRDLGISSEDIQHWKAKIESICLPDEKRLEWTRGVLEALSPFGEVHEAFIELGFVVTRGIWEELRRDDITRDEVIEALEESFTSLKPELSQWIPEVDFASKNESLLQEVLERKSFDIAAALLSSVDRGEWTEELRDDIFSRLEDMTKETSEDFHRIDFDPEEFIQNHLGIKGDELETSSKLEEAMAFVKDEIRIREFPDKELTGGTWTSRSGPVTPLLPKDFSVREKENRRKMESGEKAEIGVLNLAMENALEWIENDEEEFWQKLCDALSVVLNDAASRIEKVRERSYDEGAVRELLQVSRWMGNAGFDVMVPEFKERTVFLVEVKKVGSGAELSFYLSDNERQQAFRFFEAENAAKWQLWCVRDDNHPFDSTNQVMKLRNYESTLKQMNEDGIKVNEYQFLVKSS